MENRVFRVNPWHIERMEKMEIFTDYIMLEANHKWGMIEWTLLWCWALEQVDTNTIYRVEVKN